MPLAHADIYQGMCGDLHYAPKTKMFNKWHILDYTVLLVKQSHCNTAKMYAITSCNGYTPFIWTFSFNYQFTIEKIYELKSNSPPAYIYSSGACITSYMSYFAILYCLYLCKLSALGQNSTKIS